jgi:hypothetical protein
MVWPIVCYFTARQQGGGGGGGEGEKIKFMKVASKVASQKTTASGTPDKIATLRSIADGSFRGSPKQVRYKNFCRFGSLMPLTWCSTLT